MLFADIDPYIRFAEMIQYQSAGEEIYVRDCRFFYILSGEADLKTDGQIYRMKPNAVFYCCGGSRYCISSSGAELISVNFDLTQSHRSREQPYALVRLSDAGTLPPANECLIEDQPILNQHLFLEKGIAVREMINGILDEFSTRRILYRENASAFMKMLLVQLLRSSVETASQSAKAVEQIIGCIRTHYDQPLTNAYFSKLTGYHEYYLNRLFVRYTGSSIHQYLLDVRISHAKKLLLNTDLPLGVIAEQTGFGSSTYFSRYFRQVNGLSPTLFRRNNRNSI